MALASQPMNAPKMIQPRICIQQIPRLKACLYHDGTWGGHGVRA
jgi:hypothetical protein